MRDLTRQVMQFQIKAGESLAQRPCVPPDWQRTLKATLIFEEFKETIHAMGFDIVSDPLTKQLRLVDTGEPHITEVADGICDLHYVLAGAANAWGLPMAAVWDEVHASNMAKFADGVRYREDGKVLKPPGWKPPNIKKIIQESQDAWAKSQALRRGPPCDGCGAPLDAGVCKTEGCTYAPKMLND